MKCVCLDGFLVGHDGLPWEVAQQHEVAWYDFTPDQQIVERIGDAEAVFLNRTPITKETLKQCPNLRYIGTWGTGYNTIDVEAAKKYGVTVCNAPGYSTHAVAQSAFALLLDIVGRTSVHNAFVKAGQWQTADDAKITSVPMQELFGKTFGIVGMGEIGQQAARIALAFGMRVLAYRRNPPAEAIPQGVEYVSLEELLAQADIVSLHCPLTSQSKGMVDAGFLSKMKKGAILINTARGGLLQEDAVAEALDSGQLYMAGLDVLAEEPPVTQTKLALHPKTVVTPHIAWMPKETRSRLMDVVAQTFEAFVKGNPIHVVNK